MQTSQGLVEVLTTPSMLQKGKVGWAGWGGRGLPWFTLSPHKPGNRDRHIFGKGELRQS